jgi:hypothetical protein
VVLAENKATYSKGQMLATGGISSPMKPLKPPFNTRASKTID